MISDIFEAWVRTVDKLYCKKKCKIAIVIDNCPAHPHITGLKNVKLVFLPPNTTAKLQPMDQGVIQNLKTHYRHHMITALLEALQKKEQYNPTVLDAMILLKSSWKKVKDTTIANCFQHAGFKTEATTENTDEDELDGPENDNTHEDEGLIDQL